MSRSFRRQHTSLFLPLERFWRERDGEVGVAVVLVAAAADAELVAVGLGGVAEEGPLLRLEQVGGQAAVAHADLRGSALPIRIDTQLSYIFSLDKSIAMGTVNLEIPQLL